MKTVLHEDDRGYVIAEGNELTVGSKIDDPPKVRVTSITTSQGMGGGVISFNRSRHAGVCYGDQQDEMSMIRVAQADDVRGDVSSVKAEISFQLNDGSGSGDSAMQKALAFMHNALTRMRFVFGGSAHRDASRFYSGNGLYCWNYQDDGSVVLYATHLSADETTWTPMWAQRPNGDVESLS